MTFTDGVVKVERDWIKLRLTVARSTGFTPESVKALPVVEFFILLNELQEEAKNK